MTDRLQEVADRSGPYILELIDLVSKEPDGAVVLTAVTALAAFVLHRYDVDVPKFSEAVAEMMERRGKHLAKRQEVAS
jgi:hypothetical protein